MQLLVNNSSPYSRVVRIVVLEKLLGDRVETKLTDPWGADEALISSNPTNRVPVLITDDGVGITESLLIGHYLNSLSDWQPLLPLEHLTHALHFAGLGQGLMESAFTTVITEKFQGKEAAQSFFGLRRAEAMRRTLMTLDAEIVRGVPDAFTLGELVVGVALEYIDYRLPNLDWRKRFAALSGFLQKISARSSFQMTQFS